MWTGNKPMYFLELLNHKKTGASKYSLNQNQYFIWLESLLLVYIHLYQLLKHSSVGKQSACSAGDLGSIPGSGRSAGEGISYSLQYSWASLVVQLVKNLPAMWKTWVWSLGWEDPLEKGKVTHSSILACRFHGLYSPWGHKESDSTEWLSLSQRNHRLYCAPGSLWAITVVVVVSLGRFCRGGSSCRRQAQVTSTGPGLEQRQESFSSLFSAPNLQLTGVHRSGMCSLLYSKWISNKDLPYSTGNSAQCSVAAWMGGEFGGRWIHMYDYNNIIKSFIPHRK